VSPKVQEEFSRLREIVENYRLHGYGEDWHRSITNHVIPPWEGGEALGTWVNMTRIFDEARESAEITDNFFIPWIQYIKSKLPENNKVNNSKGGGKKTRGGKMLWKEYVKKHFTGKKFKSREESNDYMRKLSIDFKKMI
jgi:hypothetical protein